MTNNKLTLALLMCFSFGFSMAQEQTRELKEYSNALPTGTADVQELDYEYVELPPVSVFLEAARDFAEVKFYQEKQNEERLSRKVTQKEWLRYIRLQGTYQYGTNSSLILQAEELTPVDFRYSTINQSWYNAGVVVSIPLDDLFSRKNKNDISKSRVDQSQYELERTIESRQLIILEAYNEVVKHRALLKVNAESVALYDAQMQISERDFVNGKIDIIALSLERGRRTEANIKYQTSRASLHNAVSILELLTKIKITKVNSASSNIPTD